MFLCLKNVLKKHSTNFKESNMNHSSMRKLLICLALIPFFIRKKIIKACTHHTLITKNHWLNECFKIIAPPQLNVVPKTRSYDTPLLESLATYVHNQTTPLPNLSGIKPIPFKGLITYLHTGDNHD